MAEHAQPAPVGQFLLDVVRRGLGLQSQGMTGEVDQLAAAAVVWMMEFRGVRCQGILCIVREGRCCIEFRMFQAGAAITVPQTPQVRWATLE